MNRVIHFEIHIVDPEKMIKFYTEVFGWQIKEWEMPGVKPENRYWFVVTAPEGSAEPGISGGLVMRRGPKPQGGEPVSSYVNTIHVAGVDEFIKKIEAAGGKNTVPKMAIPNLAWLAYCADPEGNIFGIYEDDKNAK